VILQPLMLAEAHGLRDASADSGSRSGCRRGGKANAEPPGGSSAILGSRVASTVRRGGGGEDPWLCDPGFRRVCLCRGMRWS